MPNEITGPNAGGPRPFPIRRHWTARVGQFWRSSSRFPASSSRLFCGLRPRYRENPTPLPLGSFAPILVFDIRVCLLVLIQRLSTGEPPELSLSPRIPCRVERELRRKLCDRPKLTDDVWRFQTASVRPRQFVPASLLSASWAASTLTAVTLVTLARIAPREHVLPVGKQVFHLKSPSTSGETAKMGIHSNRRSNRRQFLRAALATGPDWQFPP